MRHNDFHFSGRPPFWIYDDVILLHPVIVFHGINIVLNFHVDWLGSFRRQKPHIYARLASGDGQTDRQTSTSLKAPSSLRWIGI